MQLTCEVKEVKAKKLASLDIEYRIVLVTADPQALQLGTLQGDELIQIDVNNG